MHTQHQGLGSEESSPPSSDTVGGPCWPLCCFMGWLWMGEVCCFTEFPAQPVSVLPPPVAMDRLTLPVSFQGSEAASKGDFLFSSDHLIEMATKLYRTTLSQTKQKLNIEISDEYVPCCQRTMPLSAAWAACSSGLLFLNTVT